MKDRRYKVMQRLSPHKDVLVSQHNSYASARRTIDEALPGDQPEMRIVEREALTTPQPPC